MIISVNRKELHALKNLCGTVLALGEDPTAFDSVDCKGAKVSSWANTVELELDDQMVVDAAITAIRMVEKLRPAINAYKAFLMTVCNLGEVLGSIGKAFDDKWSSDPVKSDDEVAV